MFLAWFCHRPAGASRPKACGLPPALRHVPAAQAAGTALEALRAPLAVPFAGGAVASAGDSLVTLVTTRRPSP